MADHNDNDISCPTCSQQVPRKKARRCAQCKSVYYCSKVCQSTDWHSHKTHCRPKGQSVSCDVVDLMENQELIKTRARYWWVRNGCPADGFVLVEHTENDKPIQLTFSWIGRTFAPAFGFYTKNLSTLKPFLDSNLEKPYFDRGLALVIYTPSTKRCKTAFIPCVHAIFEN